MAKVVITPEEIEREQLDRILNSFDYDTAYRANEDKFTSQPLCKAEAAVTAAKRKLADFLSTNAEHCRLVAAAEKAELEFNRLKETESVNRVRDVKRVRNLLRLKGVTAETRKAVADLMKKHQ